MSGRYNEHWTRRDFLKTAGLGGAGALLGLPSDALAAEPPPETTKIRLARTTSICQALQYVVEGMFEAEGLPLCSSSAERDTPEVLKRYAEGHKANPAGWAFLTGTPAEIRDIAKRYGIYYKKMPRGDVDHTFLTSLVDQSGILRVQYMGVKFNPDECSETYGAY
jgi:SCO1/SenC/TAT (twin-arginine translocation) pathway signal sequence